MKLFGAVVVAMALVLPFALTRSVPPVPHLAPSLALTERFRAISLRMPFAFAFVLTWNHHSWLGTLGPSLGSYAPTPLTEQSWKRNFSLIATSVMGKTAKKFYLGKKRNVLGSYGKRKSSISKRGDNKALHPSQKKNHPPQQVWRKYSRKQAMLLNVLDSMQKKSDLNVHKKKWCFSEKVFWGKKTRILRRKKKSEFLNNSRSIFLVVSEATVSDLPCAHHKILKIPQAYALLAAVFWQGSSSGSRNGSWKILEIFQLNSMWYWDTGSMYPGYFVALFVGWWWGLLIMMVVFQRWW